MKRAPSVRPDLSGLDPYVPGLTIEEIKDRYGLDTVIKLASNENPLGTSPLAQKALERHAAYAFRYPHNHTPRLCNALSRQLGVDAARILAGNGSDELIDLILRLVVRPDEDEIICYESCFSMYRLTARLLGAGYREVPRADDFSLPLEALAQAATEKTAAVFVTSPDNPTGLAATAAELAGLARSLPRRTLLVVDQAYIDFVDEPQAHDMRALLSELDNVVVLRTFSKAYGLGGMRLGYGILPMWLAETATAARIPFSVNLLAEEAGLAALEDVHFYEETLRTVSRGKTQLSQGLQSLGCRVLPSQANFVMFRPAADAAGVFEALLQNGIIVRPLKSFGLPEWIRVNVGTERENEQFLRQLKEIL